MGPPRKSLQVLQPSAVNMNVGRIKLVRSGAKTLVMCGFI